MEDLESVSFEEIEARVKRFVEALGMDRIVQTQKLVIDIAAMLAIAQAGAELMGWTEDQYLFLVRQLYQRRTTLDVYLQPVPPGTDRVQ